MSSKPPNTKEVCLVCETPTADKPEARSDTRSCSEDEFIGIRKIAQRIALSGRNLNVGSQTNCHVLRLYSDTRWCSDNTRKEICSVIRQIREEEHGSSKCAGVALKNGVVNDNKKVTT